VSDLDVSTPATKTASSRLVLLLAAALFINYVDRGNLATAAPLIQDELHLSNTQLGVLLSAFYWTYVAVMAPGGWLAERYGAKLILGVGVAIWSVATLLTGLAGGFLSLLLLRLLLGVGESAGFPCSSKLLASDVDPRSVGTANGVLGFGYLIGPAVGTFLGGMLMVKIGWRPVFVIFGALSLLWLWPWSRTPVNEPKLAVGPVRDDAPTLADILRQRGLWGASLGHFASNYNFYFILAWLPTYLVKTRGFSIEMMAGVAGAAYLINSISALGMGILTDRWLTRGGSANTIYKLLMGLLHGVAIGCMIGMVVLPIEGCVACLFVYQIVLGFASPGVFAIPQIMAGPTATGRWVGIQNTWGNVAGIMAPVFTGMIVDATGSFSSGFALAALINVLGLVGWLVILPKIAPIRWRSAAARTA
jgi:MFS family permease